MAFDHPVTDDKTAIPQELRVSVHSICYVRTVHPAHLLVVGLFMGVERSLPRDCCVGLSLATIAQLQSQLEALQTQKLSSSLLTMDGFLPPSEATTWHFLLGDRASQPATNVIDVTPANVNQDQESHLQKLEASTLGLEIARNPKLAAQTQPSHAPPPLNPETHILGPQLCE